MPSAYSGEVSSKTSKIHDEFPGKSCAKILLANVYLKNDPNTQMRMYVMLDDQSNRSLASPHIFNSLGVEGKKINYTLTSCSGKKQAVGRRAHNIVVESLDHSVQLQLPAVTECSHLLDNREEISTPDVAQNYSNLHDTTQHIPSLDDNAKIILLIGRDAIQAHYVLDQRVGPPGAPHA
jgi:hypothetical protein